MHLNIVLGAVLCTLTRYIVTLKEGFYEENKHSFASTRQIEFTQT